jgi:hypothetical protein
VRVVFVKLPDAPKLSEWRLKILRKVASGFQMQANSEQARAAFR